MTVLKKDLLPGDVTPINSYFVLVSLVISRYFCFMMFPGKRGRVVQ